jgi:hypothetical protein
MCPNTSMQDWDFEMRCILNIPQITNNESTDITEV